MGDKIIQTDLRNIRYKTGSIVLEQFNLTVTRGSTVAVIGRSGVGKSTILKIIAGLHHLYDGSLYIEEGIKLAFIPQANCLLPWKSVYQNIVALDKATGKPPNAESAFELIQRLGLGGLENRYPFELSGGQYQRVALGQALYYQSDVILMDEPFSSLDTDTKDEIQQLFIDLRTKIGFTTIFVTHNTQEAQKLDSVIVKLEGDRG